MPLILLSLLIFHGTICHLPWSFSPDDTSICMPHIYVALRFWLFCSSTFFDFNPATLSPRVVLFLSPFRTSAWSLQIFNLSLLTSLAGGYQHFLVASCCVIIGAKTLDIRVNKLCLFKILRVLQFQEPKLYLDFVTLNIVIFSIYYF